MASLLLDVVLPVHNEESVLLASVRRLHDYLTRTFPSEFAITIADNASTDRTAEIAAQLAGALPEVRFLRIEQKGRGRALKAAWSSSPAEVLAYTDVDLSTDLAAWPNLVGPLLSGRADIAIGSRLAPGAEVERGARREVISRCYNIVLRSSLHVGFLDAQCGFKAVRGDVARELLPHTQDDSWFFDTELLVRAERSGHRVVEVPVVWRDDPHSSVAIVRTALDDLQGIARLRRHLPRPPAPEDRRQTKTHAPATLASQVWRFAAVGVASTVLHLGLFALLAAAVFSSQVANLLALLLATLFNTAANRFFTFGVRGRTRLATHHLQALMIFAATWGLSSLALVLLHEAAPTAGTGWQTAAIATGNAVSTVLRFVALRSWIFRPSPASRRAGRGRPASTPPPRCVCRSVSRRLGAFDDVGADW